MPFPFYQATTPQDTEQAPDPVKDLPTSRRDKKKMAVQYKPDQALVDAVNVALLLNQPLLLTGEPGTGKTQLAWSLAWQLGLGEPEVFETKSTSTARDLFYTYDAIGRFHAAQVKKGSQDNVDYIEYKALGLAILKTKPRDEIKDYVKQQFPETEPCRSVVLIDEIEKAPRDFPNDLLSEIENMSFRVPEINNELIQAADDLWPVLILTSNLERNLPDAFLRRCIYHHIEFPKPNVLQEIVTARLGYFSNGNSQLLSDALDLFYRLRADALNLQKKPATAELLDWLTYFSQREISPGNSLREHQTVVKASLCTLFKEKGDKNIAQGVVQRWLDE